MPQPTPLKIAIVSSGLTAREVARRVGKDEQTISRWSNDARPVPVTARIALATVLGTTVEALWPESEELAA